MTSDTTKGAQVQKKEMKAELKAAEAEKRKEASRRQRAKSVMVLGIDLSPLVVLFAIMFLQYLIAVYVNPAIYSAGI